MPIDFAPLYEVAQLLYDGPWVAERHTVNAVLPLVEATLDELSRQWEVLASAVVPRPGVLHTDSILSLVRGFAATTGKLLRPRMAHWGWVAAGGLDHGRGHDDLIRIGAALELLHCFALVHDDVMDASDVRRGLPAAHRQFETWHSEHGLTGSAEAFGRAGANESQLAPRLGFKSAARAS